MCDVYRDALANTTRHQVFSQQQQLLLVNCMMFYVPLYTSSNFITLKLMISEQVNVFLNMVALIQGNVHRFKYTLKSDRFNTKMLDDTD